MMMMMMMMMNVKRAAHPVPLQSPRQVTLRYRRTAAAAAARWGCGRRVMMGLRLSEILLQCLNICFWGVRHDSFLCMSICSYRSSTVYTDGDSKKIRHGRVVQAMSNYSRVSFAYLFDRIYIAAWVMVFLRSERTKTVSLRKITVSKRYVISVSHSWYVACQNDSTDRAAWFMIYNS